MRLGKCTVGSQGHAGSQINTPKASVGDGLITSEVVAKVNNTFAECRGGWLAMDGAARPASKPLQSTHSSCMNLQCKSSFHANSYLDSQGSYS